MRLSQLFFETRKEMPKDAQMMSHKMLIKGGYISMSSAGMYSYLPLFYRVYKKTESIIIEEMERIGAQQLLLPALTPKEIWDRSGRWEDFGKEMFRLKDRKDRDYALCPTHEEIITDIAQKHIKSYKQMPQIWFQIQTKFRDEPRPRSGLLRVRQFEMKDSYSFDMNFEDLDISYKKHRRAYQRIFRRMGIDFTIVQAASGLMGGAKSEEFMAISDSGEDSTVICNKCGYSSNTEVARVRLDYTGFESGKLEEIHTPVNGDVESVSKFMEQDKNHFIKSILVINEANPLFVLIPGDREIDEKKLDMIIEGRYKYADDDEILRYTGANKGYISPIGKDIPVIADECLKGTTGMISGANRDHYHVKNIDINRDINNIHYANIIAVNENDKCPECGSESIEIKKCIEIGHIFQLGTKYSQALGAVYSDENGDEKPIVMGSYGIGLGRIISTVIEQHHDKYGIKWPISIAPYRIAVLPLNVAEQEIRDEGERIYSLMNEHFRDVLIDDRDIRAGAKFNDADLIGAPIRIVIGRTFKESGKLELISRQSGNKQEIDTDNVINAVKSLIEEEESLYECE